MEVRFREPSRLYRLVLSALRTKFLTLDLRAPLQSPPQLPGDALPQRGAFVGSGPAFGRASSPPEPWFGGPAVPAWKPQPPLAAGSPAVAPAPLPGWDTGDSDPAVARAGNADSAGRPASERAVQMHERYIVVESREGIEVIDQHALHERVLYERFKGAILRGSLEVQPLLIPERLDLSPADLEVVTDHAGALAAAGLRVEPFGGATVIVTAKPVLAGKTAAADLLRGVIDRIAAMPSPAPSLLVDEVLHGLACKAAIKAGDPLSQEEVDSLVRDRLVVTEAHHCPHGRPTSLTLSRQELDRQFRRT